MTWVVLAFVLAAAVIGARIYFNVRKVQRSREESWDARMIERLRTQGYAPFNDYPIDFFLALPDEPACAAVRSRLEGEGFSIDVKPMENDPELHFSLHAARRMRLIVPEMQDLSRRLSALAAENRGRYDGWTA